MDSAPVVQANRRRWEERPAWIYARLVAQVSEVAIHPSGDNAFRNDWLAGGIRTPETLQDSRGAVQPEFGAVPSENPTPDVVMMQPAQDWSHIN